MKTINFLFLIVVTLFVTISAQAQSIQDSDGDTKVDTEKTSDDDIIRFTTGGNEVLRLTNRTLGFFGTGNSIFIGKDAGANDDLSNNNNLFIGTNCGILNTSGANNAALGINAFKGNLTGGSNFACGTNAMEFSNSNNNVAMGSNAMRQQTSGSNNVGVGSQAGRFNQGGSQNTLIGASAGRGTSNHNKSGNIFIGYQAGYNEIGSDKLYIENSNSSSPLIGGDFSADRVDINGDLDVFGSIDMEGGNEFLDVISTSTSLNGFRFYDSGLFDGAIFYDEENELINITSGSGTSGLIYNFGTDNASLGVPGSGQVGKFHIRDNTSVTSPHLNLDEVGSDYARLQFSNDQGTEYWQIAGRPNATTPKLNFFFSDASGGTNVMTITGDDDHVGIGDDTPSYPLDVKSSTESVSGGIIYAENTSSTASDVRAIRGVSTPADGFGYGVYGQGGYRGIYGFGDGGAYTGTTTGVYGIASGTGTAGTRTGIYGTASGGTTNWAGFFASGNVYVTNDLRIGTTAGAAGYKVAVNGKIISEELKVQDSGAWPDYVFESEYELKSLEEVEASINENGHLPGIPSAKQVEEDGGFHVGDMQKKTLEKVEELTLYLIESNKQIKALQEQNAALLQRIEQLENK
ncbi:MAG: hypothetical protein AAF573_12660 [Bacteroidota bacterium]